MGKWGNKLYLQMIIYTSTTVYINTALRTVSLWVFGHTYTTAGLFVVDQKFLDNGASRSQQLDCSECDQSVHTATEGGVKGLV